MPGESFKVFADLAASCAHGLTLVVGFYTGRKDIVTVGILTLDLDDLGACFGLHVLLVDLVLDLDVFEVIRIVLAQLSQDLLVGDTLEYLAFLGILDKELPALPSEDKGIGRNNLVPNECRCGTGNIERIVCVR